MATRSSSERIQQADTTMKRRGILAAAVAVVAGIVAKYAAQPVAAVTGGSEGGALVLGANDIFGALPRSKSTAGNPTQLTNTSGTVTAAPTAFFHQGAGLIVTASDGTEGIMGLANGPSGIGVWGVSNRGRAVYGEITGSGLADGGKGVSGDAGSNTNAYGVYGTAYSATSIGVYGQCGQGIGVQGESTSGTGVFGQSSSNAGVYGHSTSNAGVFGDSPVVAVAGFSGGGIGVQGTSGSNAGVLGQSTSNAAVFGTSPFAGVFGTSSNVGVWGTTTSGTGVFGQVTGASGFAGQFAGNVFVSGTFTVVNGAKSAAVKRRDGSHARVYCQESPEPWFEDFGTAQLQNGGATVALSSDFDEVVDGTDYRVFLTEIGDCGGLYVSTLAPHRFDVKSRAGAVARGTFHYRVVAKRADPVGTRMEKVDLPAPPQTVRAPRALSVDELPKPPSHPGERPAAPERNR